MSSDLILPTPAAPLLPQQLPMRLITALTDCDGDRAESTASFAADSLFAQADGTVHPLGCVELMAQTYAAMRGYASQSTNQPPHRGRLVGVANFNYFADLHLGETCRTTVETRGVFGPFSFAQAQVWCGATLIANGTVKIWEELPEGQPS